MLPSIGDECLYLHVLTWVNHKDMISRAKQKLANFMYGVNIYISYNTGNPICQSSVCTNTKI